MKSIVSVTISFFLACCVLSCKDQKAKNNLFLLPVSGSSTTGSTADAVPCGSTDAEAAAADAANLSASAFTFAAGDSQISVKQNFSLPVTGACGSTIAWASNDTGTVSVTGADATVTRPPTVGSGDVNVMLVALVTRGTAASSREIMVNVIRRAWVQDAYLKASNLEEDDLFGDQIAVSGDTIVVGVPDEDSSATGVTNDDGSHSHPGIADKSGAVYVYKRDASGNWVQDAYLKASNGEAGDQFGYSVAIDGSTIVVGSQSEDRDLTDFSIDNRDGSPVAEENDGMPGSGAAYVFQKDASGNWVQDAYLKASNAGGNDMFGCSVAVSGDTIVVGARSEGRSVADYAINNDNGHPTIAESNNGALASGAVYVFRKTGNDWVQDAFLKASNAEAEDYFGSHVAVSGDIIAVSATSEDSNQTTINNADDAASADNSSLNTGAVYVFKRDAATGSWSQDAYLKASNSTIGANVNLYFGYSLALSGSIIAVGSRNEQCRATGIINSDGVASMNYSTETWGAAYLFRNRGSGYWTQDAYLKGSNADNSDYFGGSISVSGGLVVVGAGGEMSDQTTITNDDNVASGSNAATNYGAAYVFREDASGNWAQDAYLKASNADGSDVFGSCVAVDGSTIVVGAYREDSNEPGIINTDGSASMINVGAGYDSGAAYVFTIK